MARWVDQMNARLPYRVRDGIQRWRLARAMRPLSQAAPTAVADAPRAHADAELHLLVCRRDLLLAQLAAASLLRFAPGRLAVTFWSDGSLRAKDLAQLGAAFPGARLLDWAVERHQPTVTKALSARPHLSKLVDSGYACCGKLLGPVLMSRCDRAIVLDPDAVFFGRPTQLLAWLAGDGAANLYLFDRTKDEATAVPAAVQGAFHRLQLSLAERFGTTWQIGPRFFNSGLIAMRPGGLDLDHAEHYLAWRSGLEPSLRRGTGSIWFGDWTPEQTCFLVMLACAIRPAEPLDPTYVLGPARGATMNHFLRSGLAGGSAQRRLAALARCLAHPADDRSAPTPTPIPSGPTMPNPAANALRLAVRWYLQHFPLQRGKWRVWSLLNRHLPEPRIDPDTPIRVKPGFRLHLRPGQYLDRSIYYWGGWEEDETGVVQSLLKPGDTFVDVGAHMGYLTLAAAQAVGPTGRVIAFEPTPATRAMLRRNVTLNDATMVEVRSDALWESPALLRLEIRHGDNDGMNRLVPADATTPTTDVIRATSLDLALGRVMPTLVKIDVEGAEWSVLRGLREHLAVPNGPAVLVEVTPQWLRDSGGSTAGLFGWLDGLGYEALRLHRGRLLTTSADEVEARGQLNLLFRKRPAGAIARPAAA